jgi:ankyrin repeat protein
MYAVRKRYPELQDLLKAANAHLDWAEIDANPITISDAIIFKDFETVKQFVKRDPKSINQEANNFFGFTPLMVAIEGRELELARFLIEHGADVNHVVSDACQATPLHCAACEETKEILSLLLQRGADPNVYDEPRRMTPLLFAAKNGSADCVRLLLNHGADITARETYEHRSALMFAQQNRHASVVELLRKYGAE